MITHCDRLTDRQSSYREEKGAPTKRGKDTRQLSQQHTSSLLNVSSLSSSHAYLSTVNVPKRDFLPTTRTSVKIVII